MAFVLVVATVLGPSGPRAPCVGLLGLFPAPWAGFPRLRPVRGPLAPLRRGPVGAPSSLLPCGASGLAAWPPGGVALGPLSPCRPPFWLWPMAASVAGGRGPPPCRSHRLVALHGLRGVVHGRAYRVAISPRSDMRSPGAFGARGVAHPLGGMPLGAEVPSSARSASSPPPRDRPARVALGRPGILLLFEVPCHLNLKEDSRVCLPGGSASGPGMAPTPRRWRRRGV